MVSADVAGVRLFIRFGGHLRAILPRAAMAVGSDTYIPVEEWMTVPGGAVHMPGGASAT